MMAISTSSLLNSAAARRNKIQEQEDALVAFEFSLSAKTYGDFVAYNDYLQDRASKNADDASKVLSYQKAIVGARKGYISNEIQRANIDIAEGRVDNNTKYERMKDLFYQALDNGDYDLAQSLNLQLDNLSVKIQQDQIAKQEAGQRAAGAMAAAGVKSLKDLVKTIKEGNEEITLPDGRVIAGIGKINQELRNGNVSDYFAALYDTTKTLQGIVKDAYDAAPDQDTVDKIESSFKDLLEGNEKFASLTDVEGKEKKLTMSDIELAYRSAAANNPIYSLENTIDPATGKQVFGLKENKKDDFVWTRNDDGTYSAVTTRVTVPSPNQTLDTRITDEGYIVGKNNKTGKGDSVANDSGLSIGNRLQSLGISAKSNSDGSLDLVVPGVGQTKGMIQPDGSIRYFGAPGNYSGIDQDGNPLAGLYEIKLTADGAEYIDSATGQKVGGRGGTREVAPDEISDFGDESLFGGQLSKSSQRGKNYIQNLAGLSPVNSVAPVDLRSARLGGMGQPTLLSNSINIGDNFSGTGSPVVHNLLQGATFTQGKVLQEKQATIALQAQQEAAQRLQQAQVFNLNQTPVAQYGSNGAPIRQLKVAQPIPQRISSVSVAPPTQRITSVSNYNPTGQLPISGFSGTLRVQ